MQMIWKLCHPRIRILYSSRSWDLKTNIWQQWPIS